MELSGSQKKAFYKAILDAFTRSELERLVSFDLDEELEHITGNGPLRDVAFELIAWVDREGRLDELLKAVGDAKPKNAKVAAFMKMLDRSDTPYDPARDVYHLQNETFVAIGEGRLAEADNLLQQTEDLIEDALKRWPDDTALRNLQGYHHKNVAIEYRALSMRDAADDHLHQAEKAFRLILMQDKNDASAWNGLGSVHAMRGELDKAEVYIQKALAIQPNYGAAKQDLAMIQAYKARLNQQGAA